jgi:hypothetical protein
LPLPQDRDKRLFQSRLADVDGTRLEELPPLIRHPDHGGIGTQEPDRSLGDRLQRRLQREALRERAGDLVEGPQLLGGLPLGLQRLLALADELLRLFVQPRILDRDGKLTRQGADELRSSAEGTSPREVDGEQARHFLAREKGHGKSRLYPRLGRGARHAPETALRGDVVEEEEAARAKTAQRELQQPLGDGGVGSRHAALGGAEQLLVVEQVDGKPVDAEHVRDALDHRLEGVRERELRHRLSDDAEQGLRPLELRRLGCGALACPKEIRRADREVRKGFELLPRRRRLAAEEELQSTESRAPELKRGRVARRCRQTLPDRLQNPAPARLEGAHRELPCPIEFACGGRGAERGGELGLAAVRGAPEHAARGACRFGGKPGDVLGRTLLVGAGGERVACELEPCDRPRGCGRGLLPQL